MRHLNRTKRLDEAELLTIKRLYAEGYSQRQIAKSVKCSQASVSNIVGGFIHEDIPWPNGRMGSFSDAYPDHKTHLLNASESHKVSLGATPRVLENVPEQGAKEALQTQALSPDIAQGVRRLSAQIDEEREQTAWEKIKAEHHINTDGVEEPAHSKISPLDVNFIPWGEIKELDPNNPLIEVAEDDETLQRAIGIVFCSFPKKQWHGDQVLRAIDLVKKQLENEA